MDAKQSWDKHWGSPATIKRLKTINTAYPEVVQVLLDLTNEKSNCIELGCGSGTYAIKLLAKGRKCLASDFSPEALELVKIKGREMYGLNVPVQLVDVYNIPYPENTFDLVFSDGVIEHLDIQRALKEMERVLKPGGWMVAKVPSGSWFYRLVHFILSPIENRPYEVWLSKKQWEDKIVALNYKNITVSMCGSVLIGLANRLPKMKNFIKYIPNFAKIYFLVKAQKK